jgi:hypothetical protein
MSDPPTARRRVSLPAWRAILHCSGERGKKGVEPAPPGPSKRHYPGEASICCGRPARSDQTRAGIADLQEIERMQRIEEAIVVTAQFLVPKSTTVISLAGSTSTK